MQPITTCSLRHAMTFVVLCTALLQAHAARLALVIGNDQYQAVDKLKNARNDATLMASVLKKAGFDVTQASDLGRERLWSTIDTFKARLGKGDEVVFYFAGHGVQIGSNQLLLPTDIKALNEGQVQRDGVPLVDIQDALKDARVAVFIIDACRDNPFPKVGTRSLGATRGLLPPEPSTGQIIMLSAGRNQKALDEVPGVRSSNGLFTWELAQVLQTPGIEIRAALEQVKEAVDDKAKRARHEQRPSLVNDLRGNFYFIAPGANVIIQQAAPAPAQRQQSADEAEQELWDSIKNANSVEALNAYLQEFPGGKFLAQARVLIAKLRAHPASPPASQQVVPAPGAVAQAPAVATAPRAGDVTKDSDKFSDVIAKPSVSEASTGKGDYKGSQNSVRGEGGTSFDSLPCDLRKIDSVQLGDAYVWTDRIRPFSQLIKIHRVSLSIGHGRDLISGLSDPEVLRWDVAANDTDRQYARSKQSSKVIALPGDRGEFPDFSIVWKVEYSIDESPKLLTTVSCVGYRIVQ